VVLKRKEGGTLRSSVLKVGHNKEMVDGRWKWMVEGGEVE